MKKVAKPATEAQKNARERNWNKGQVLCIKSIADNLHRSKTTKNPEKMALEIITNQLNKILTAWNK